MVVSALSAAAAASITTAGQSSETIWQGVYTAEQAKRGEAAYSSNCSYCHRDDLSGGFFDDGNGRAPALAGPRAFDSSLTSRWGDASMGEMIATIASTMPQQRPATLTLQTYVDIVSYILMKNGVPSGNRELPTDVEALQRIVITEKQ